MVSILSYVICSRTFFFILSCLMINVVTTPSDCDRCDQSLLTPTLNVLKIEKIKNKSKKVKIRKKNKKRQSLLLAILTIVYFL